MEQPKQTRILSDVNGNGRLLVKTDEQGMWVWNKYKKQPELVPWEKCLAAYEKTKPDEKQGDQEAC